MQPKTKKSRQVIRIRSHRLYIWMAPSLTLPKPSPVRHFSYILQDSVSSHMHIWVTTRESLPLTPACASQISWPGYLNGCLMDWWAWNDPLITEGSFTCPGHWSAWAFHRETFLKLETYPIASNKYIIILQVEKKNTMCQNSDPTKAQTGEAWHGHLKNGMSPNQ